MWNPSLLGVLLFVGSWHSHCRVAAKKLPLALEASFKSRITEKLNVSAEAAAAHIATRLGLDGDLFGGYELELGDNGDNTPKWSHSCMEVDTTRDSVEYCALRQLHALTALCDHHDYISQSKAAAQTIRKHLKMFTSKEIEKLGLIRNKFEGMEIWFHHKTPDGPLDDVDASPALQASALMALVRCADAVDERQYFTEAESWFLGLQKIYPEKLWKTELVSFHKSGIIWESLALVALHLPVESSFHSQLLEYVNAFESYLWNVWQEDTGTWSFASARALTIRWHSKTLKPQKRRSLVKKWAKEHVERFLGTPKKHQLGQDGSVYEGIFAKMGGAGYTCGPLQGLASLAAVLANAELVQVVLKLLEKDVDKYQLSIANVGPSNIFRQLGEKVDGAFFRDDQQLKAEKRRTLRVDDVAQCTIALTQVLRTLEGMRAVEVQGVEDTATTDDNGKGSDHGASDDGGSSSDTDSAVDADLNRASEL